LVSLTTNCSPVVAPCSAASSASLFPLGARARTSVPGKLTGYHKGLGGLTLQASRGATRSCGAASAQHCTHTSSCNGGEAPCVTHLQSVPARGH
jgi:hypothetical protein